MTSFMLSADRFPAICRVLIELLIDHDFTFLLKFSIRSSSLLKRVVKTTKRSRAQLNNEPVSFHLSLSVQLKAISNRYAVQSHNCTADNNWIIKQASVEGRIFTFRRYCTSDDDADRKRTCHALLIIGEKFRPTGG